MNILSLIQSQISSPTVDRISSALGESPEGTKSALGTAFPALLGSLIGKANSSPNGASDIFNMLKQGQGQTQGAWPEHVEDLAGSVSNAAPSPAHQSLLTSLMGSKLGGVSEFLSARSGIRQGSAMSLLGMAAPLLMGTLRRHVSSSGLDSAGLGQLLNSQAGYVKESLPSELGNMLGLKNLLPSSASVPPVTAKYADQRTTIPTPAMREPAGAGAGRVLRWAWVPLLIALAGWFALSHSYRRQPAVGGTSETSGTTVTTGHVGGTPDLSHLQLTPGGPADQLAKSISAGNWDKRVDLSGMRLDNAGNLPESAKSGIHELASVMSASPNLEVRIIGQGSTADAGLAEANAIKNALVSAGVSEGRVMANGEPGSGLPTISVVR